MYYEYQDFSKNDKKQLIALVSLGAQREIEQFLKKSLLKNQEIVLKNHEDIRKPYWELYEQFKNFSKQLTNTYDGWRHRELPGMIAGLLVDGYLLETDVADFSSEGREKLAAMEQRIRNYRATLGTR